MAIINKIREKSGLAVGVVAIGLILFLIGGDLLSGRSSFLMGDKNSIGEIAGEDISATAYQDEIRKLEEDFAINQGRRPGEPEMNAIREEAWNQLIYKHAFVSEFEKVGIVISPEENDDMITGKNIHPAIKNAFTNPQTGQFNVQNILDFKKNLSQAPPQQQLAWRNFVTKLPEFRLRSKYEALLNNTLYVTNAEAQKEYASQTEKAEIKYLFIPYTSISDSAVKVTDDQLAAYLSENKDKYQVKDTRTIAYAQFPVQATAADTAYFKKELDEAKTEFETTENDTAYAATKSDFPVSKKSLSVGQLPTEIAGIASSLEKGKVYGPFVTNGNYTLYKVSDIKTDGTPAIRASHILIKPKSESEEDKKAAQQQAADLIAKIKKGESFEELARINGTDGTAPKGGDLGWFSEGAMVKPFEDAVFNFNKVGLLPEPVKTDFGYHVIKVTAPKTRVKYEVVSIEKAITPSEETREQAYAKASEFRSLINTPEEFEEQLKKAGLEKQVAPKLTKQATNVNDIQEARELVRWAFNDAAVGQLSDVKEFTDRYVVAVLTAKTEEGTAKVEDVKDALTIEVRKQEKAKQIIEKLDKSGSLESIAQKYGPQAIVNVNNNVNPNNNAMPDFGFDPASVGKVFGIKKGKQSAPYAAENGVAIISVTGYIPAPEIADYSMYKNQLKQRYAGRTQYYIMEAIKEVAGVEDNRVKFF